MSSIDTMTVVYGAKGGVGTTTVAASLALLTAEVRPTLLLDLAGDCHAVLGVPESDEPTSVMTQLWLAKATNLAGLDALLTSIDPDVGIAVIVDAGKDAGITPAGAHGLFVVGPCYLALRRAVVTSHRKQPDGFAFVRQEGRALRREDIADVLGLECLAEIPWDAAIARAIDAGLLSSRMPSPLKRALRHTGGRLVP